MSAEDATRAVLTQDNRVLIEQPDGSYRPAQSRTDWARVRALSDEEVEAAAPSDPDAPPLDETFWREARVVVPGQIRKRRTGVRIDDDVLGLVPRAGPRLPGTHERGPARLRRGPPARGQIGRPSAWFWRPGSFGFAGATPSARNHCPRNLAPTTELASARAERPFAAHDTSSDPGKRPVSLHDHRNFRQMSCGPP
jgi:hypothetical protein